MFPPRFQSKWLQHFFSKKVYIAFWDINLSVHYMHKTQLLRFLKRTFSKKHRLVYTWGSWGFYDSGPFWSQHMIESCTGRNFCCWENKSVVFVVCILFSIIFSSPFHIKLIFPSPPIIFCSILIHQYWGSQENIHVPFPIILYCRWRQK